MYKKMTIKYRRARITVVAEKPKKCEACGRKGKLDRHHWIYEFETETVKKNPQLVLKNTSILCFTCHNLANSLKHVTDELEKNPESVHRLINLQGQIMRKKYFNW